MIIKQSASEAMQSYLLNVQAAVNQIIDPSTQQPVQIPDFDTIYQAAGNLNATPYPADMAYVITSVLDRASNYGCESPAADYPLSFPFDHHIHPTMGAEWYWVGCHLNVTDQNGNAGRLGVLVSTQKNRCIGYAEQQAAGWTDAEAMLFANIATVTIDMENGDQQIVRRSKNSQWPLTGGDISYSSPGDENFLFKCGADAIWGSADVVPLNVLVDDGENMYMELQLTTKPEVTGTPFFLQGVPSLSGNGGTGITTIPTPGIYYSWPQLNVTGTITVQGKTYTINSGIGWIDHQLMMSSLENANGAATPVPFVGDPLPYNGWTWQYYNLDNGDAFTGASFILGDMVDNPPINYAYYLRLTAGEWKAYFTMGGNQLLDFTTFPAPVCESGSSASEISIPIERSYQNLKTLIPLVEVSGTAYPWYCDGTFNNPNWGVASENPADYKDSTGTGSDGVGFLETVSFEPIANFRARSLQFLATGVLPCS